MGAPRVRMCTKCRGGRLSRLSRPSLRAMRVFALLGISGLLMLFQDHGEVVRVRDRSSNVRSFAKDAASDRGFGASPVHDVLRR